MPTEKRKSDALVDPMDSPKRRSLRLASAPTSLNVANSPTQRPSGSGSSSKKKRTPSKKPVPQEILDNLYPVPDNIGYDLNVLFVGINPGLKSAAMGHHFAGPTNHFWPCLFESGFTDRRLHWSEDVTLPTHYNLGIANLTQRATRQASDLTLAEQQLSVPELVNKIRRYRPRFVCFVGKSAFEIFAGRKCERFGVQRGRVPWGEEDGGGKGSRLYAMPSTSGLVVAYQRPAKVAFFRELRELVDEMRREAGAVDPDGLLMDTDRKGDALVVKEEKKPGP